MSRVAVFAYGSLVSPSSAADTLARPVPAPIPARLEGHARRWTLCRDNLHCEKTFARAGDGSLPGHCLGLNLEPDPAGAGVNGALLEVSAGELELLDRRELRFRRMLVTDAVRLSSSPTPGAAAAARFDRVFAYRARPEHRAARPPADAIVIASYLEVVEAAFAELGDGELAAFRATTPSPPVEVVAARLVGDRIAAGNPRDW